MAAKPGGKAEGKGTQPSSGGTTTRTGQGAGKSGASTTGGGKRSGAKG